jgi:hypothetical protein
VAARPNEAGTGGLPPEVPGRGGAGGGPRPLRLVRRSPPGAAAARALPAQLIQVGDQQAALPPEVTVAEWGLEKVRWQNPLLRSFLGCIQLLEGVLDSNYVILHCSPERLLEIWRQVRQVADLIRTKVGPLLAGPSRIPELAAARRSGRLALDLLSGSVLRELERYPRTLRSEDRIEVRKLLCVSIGMLHAFLQDAFTELMAADPRSAHDADYFLSKRFPRDIDEAEWLYASVAGLGEYLRTLGKPWPERLSALGAHLQRQAPLPSPRTWGEVLPFLQELIEILTPKLKEVLALRGIRFDEMEILDRYAVEIPTRCRMLIALYETGREAAEGMKAGRRGSLEERERNVQDLLDCHAVFRRRMTRLVSSLEQSLHDLMAFVPIWLESIGQRRALLLQKPGEAGARGAAGRLPSTAPEDGARPSPLPVAGPVNRR